MLGELLRFCELFCKKEEKGMKPSRDENALINCTSHNDSLERHAGIHWKMYVMIYLNQQSKIPGVTDWLD